MIVQAWSFPVHTTSWEQDHPASDRSGLDESRIESLSEIPKIDPAIQTTRNNPRAIRDDGEHSTVVPSRQIRQQQSRRPIPNLTSPVITHDVSLIGKDPP